MDVKCGMLSVECGHAPREYFSHGCHRSTQKPCRVLLSKNTDCTDAHGWVFSRILYSCSAVYRLGYRCAAGATDCHGFFRRRRVVWENVTRWACLVCEKSVEIREICGRQISAQCAKEQAGCFYSPTDLSDKHRCHAGCLYQKHGLHRCARMGLFTDHLLLLRCLPLGFDAPPAQRIATDFFAGGRCAAERKICGNLRDLWATTKRAMR